MSGRALDPEIARLLLEEVRRHEGSLGPHAPPLEQKRALHALKGSAAIAGERAFSEALGRIERRLGTGDASALTDARALLADASAALQAGRAIPCAVWPEPPDDLRVSAIDPDILARYGAEMTDRLERIDRALAAGDDALAAAAAYRDVHAMKGAALAAGDEVTAWFCHGLEEQLRTGERSEADARRALAEVGRWRGVLAEMLAAPDRALETLRLLAHPTRTTRPPSTGLPLPPRRPTAEPAGEIDPARSAPGETTLRVTTGTLDRLFERVRQLGQARAQVASGVGQVLDMAGRARHLRMGLAEALRLIGPPRPWGAPAAAIARVEEAAQEIGRIAERLDQEASLLKEAGDRVRVESAAAHGELGAIRTTKVGSLFDRVAGAIAAQARREGREVRVVLAGEETAIDRRLAEGLFDPVLQLARNAITHGYESATERALRGKPRALSVYLRAQPRSGGLRVVVEDDGAGVDTADVRVRAIARGTLSPEMSRVMDDQTLLALLFVPGFTTRDSADLLAGRGVGLDLTLEAVRRLGGTIRLTSIPGMGVTAALDIPFEPGLVKVLWLDAQRTTYALPVQHARRVVLGRDLERGAALPLEALLDGPVRGRRSGGEEAPAAFAVELDAGGDGAGVLIGVDRVGAVEEVALRGVSPIVATAGPYAGAIVRGDELRLCLDAHALAERAGAPPGGRPSRPPEGRP
jgi:two-component system, chemotaxis family, sensor kinase CheA